MTFKCTFNRFRAIHNVRSGFAALVMASIYFGYKSIQCSAHTIDDGLSLHRAYKRQTLNRQTMKFIVAIRFYINNLYRLRAHRTFEPELFSMWCAFTSISCIRAGTERSANVLAGRRSQLAMRNQISRTTNTNQKHNTISHK